jgi:hypothetical protein
VTAHWAKDYEPLQAALDAWSRPFDFSGSADQVAEAERRARERAEIEASRRAELEDDTDEHERPIEPQTRRQQ